VVSLYDFLYRFREYLLLILAIILSFVLIFSNDNPRVRRFQAKTVQALSIVQQPLLQWKRLGNLQEENQRLQRRIVELSLELQQRDEAALENRRLRKLLDFQQDFELGVQPAKIVNRGTSPIVNSVTINLGRAHGIRENQAAVVSEGVVGKTINIAQRSSIVQLLTDVNFRLSVKTQRSRANGILVWEHYNICAMKNVAKSLDVQVGDTVITSGYSDIFPEGLLVGQVIEASNDLPGYHKEIRLRTFVNFSALEEVFIVSKQSEPMVANP